jgi:hypothetical protein
LEEQKMRKTRKALYTLGLCGALALGFLMNGSLMGSANPGGPQDPLVTQSYVDQAIRQALADFAGAPHDGAPKAECAGLTFVPVRIFAGHVILGGEGTEIILRSGEAAAFVPGPDGIVNTTVGADMHHGTQIATNHYLIIPRADGRGIMAITDAWFMVKGDFEVVLAP